MQFEIGYYVNQENEMFYFNCLAIDSRTNQEIVVVYMGSDRVNRIVSKSVWSEQFKRCENQFDACQRFQHSKLISETLQN